MVIFSDTHGVTIRDRDVQFGADLDRYVDGVRPHLTIDGFTKRPLTQCFVGASGPAWCVAGGHLWRVTVQRLAPGAARAARG